jgi:hypothetical protein
MASSTNSLRIAEALLSERLAPDGSSDISNNVIETQLTLAERQE